MGSSRFLMVSLFTWLGREVGEVGLAREGIDLDLDTVVRMILRIFDEKAIQKFECRSCLGGHGETSDKRFGRICVLESYCACIDG